MALTQVQPAMLGTPQPYNFKNRIINGAMVIDQRNAGASVTPATNDYTLDRWNSRNSIASKYSVQQNAGSVTTPAGFKNYLGITSLAATTVGSTDFYLLRQAIEGFNLADLGWGTANAKTVTLSFLVYSSLTGTFGGSLKNASDDRSYPFSYSIPVANTWTTISVTIAGDTTGTWLTTNGVGVWINFGLGVASTYSGTAGSWAAANYLSATGATSVVGTNGATFYITGVQLEVGVSATGFDYRPYGTELALCQRYYCKSFEIATAPAASAATNFSTNLTAYATTAFFIGGIYKYPVQMRSGPTVTFYTVNSGSSSNNLDYYSAGGWQVMSATAVNTSSSSQLSMYGNASGLTQWASYLVAGNFTASAEL